MDLKSWLDFKRMKRTDLAKKLRVTPTHITDLAGKKCLPSLKLAVRIEDLTDGAVTVRDWLPETSEPSASPEFSESLPAEPEPAPVSLSLSLPPR